MFSWVDEFDAFLFDFDGLLVDSEPLHYRAFKALCASFDMIIPWSFDDYCRIAHAGGTSLADHTIALFPEIKERFGDWLTFYVQKEPFFIKELENTDIPLMKGVKELLETLEEKKKAMCVVTHSKRAWVDIIRAKMPLLNAIENWISRDDYKEPKPSPEGFLKGIALLNAEGKRVIGFEDANRGIIALQGTPAKRVLIQQVPKYPQEFLNDPDFYFCESFEDVGKALLQKS